MKIGCGTGDINIGLLDAIMQVLRRTARYADSASCANEKRSPAEIGESYESYDGSSTLEFCANERHARMKERGGWGHQGQIAVRVCAPQMCLLCWSSQYVNNHGKH